MSRTKLHEITAEEALAGDHINPADDDYMVPTRAMVAGGQQETHLFEYQLFQKRAELPTNPMAWVGQPLVEVTPICTAAEAAKTELGQFVLACQSRTPEEVAAQAAEYARPEPVALTDTPAYVRSHLLHAAVQIG